jgi:AcrR family transcriptional regulator
MPAAALSTAPLRKPFRHAGEEARRAALIAAALDCVAEGGLAEATVRAIALRAGVTQGLIRHYFPSKDDLIAAAYQSLMDRLSGEAEAAIAEAGEDPAARLAAFVRGALGSAATDPRLLAAWAGFVGAMHRTPALRRLHEASYRGFRARLEGLIAEARAASGRPVRAAAVRRQAIAVNAVLDGLWLEGGLLPEAFAPGELAELGLAATAAMLAADLDEGDTE